MGQLSLILVVAAFLISGVIVYNANGASMRADEKVWEHQNHVLARDVATTGMARAVRILGENLNTDWSGNATTSINTLSDVTYGNGIYTVQAVSGSGCSFLHNWSSVATNLLGGFAPTSYDYLEIRSTGTTFGIAGGDMDQSHQIAACYLQSDYNNPEPPAFQYSFISNEQFDFNGGPDIQSIDGEGSVHSNQTMDLGPQVTIVGHATYTTEPSTNQSDQVTSFGQGTEIPMVQFDPEEFRNAYNLPATGSASTAGSGIHDDGTSYHFRYDDVPPTLSDGDVIGVDGSGNPLGTADQPFIWFVDDALSIGADVQIPVHTIIMTTGTMDFQGNANVTTTGQTPEEHCGCNNPTQTQIEAWVEAQLIDGHPPQAWYSNGDVTINGTPNVIGNFYTNGNFTLDGGGQGGNLVGSIAAYGDITANGGGNGNNFWFVEVGEQNIIPGVLLPGKQIIRVALAEWTDPVLDN